MEWAQVRWPVKDMAFRDQIFKPEMLSLETRSFEFTNLKFVFTNSKFCVHNLEISSQETGQCKMQTAD